MSDRLPTKEQVLEAIKKVQGLSAAQIDSAITEKVGDPLMAGFQFVARDLLGDKPSEALQAQRVQLMVYAYLMCIELR